jgi:predicted ATPase/predicted Ser/Thr protein kinase
MIGRTLGHFRILQKLGSGGMGDVYLAEDHRLNRKVALKVLRSDARWDSRRRDWLVREAKALSALNHPNVAAIHDIGEASGIRFIVMEYVEGPTLTERIADSDGHGLSTEDTVQIGAQIADALAAAHAKQIIHRDIKPGNVVFTLGEQLLKILDFGLAKFESGRNMQPLTSAPTREATELSGEISGTASYMSPEQALGRIVDRRTDIFSLGIVLYELATARLPFKGETVIDTLDRILHDEPIPPSRLNPRVHPELERVISKCLEKEVERRYQNADDLLVDLRNLKRETDAHRAVSTSARRPGRVHIPVQMTSFVGRARELTEVSHLLTAERLVTLTGVGGTGKSRLSAEVARAMGDRFSGGVFLIELAALSDPRLVPQAVASSLGVYEASNRAPLATLSDSLKNQSILLVIDNCEHLLLACAELCESLLRSCPELRILATSRESLAVAGERVYPVPPLSLPALARDSTGGASIAALAESEAVRLFVDRVAARQPQFAVTTHNASTIADICHRLDGIPLALELAAARIKTLSIEQIRTRLADRFHLLTGGSRTALPRQQTLRASLDWSCELLSEDERTLLWRLSVFAGGWRLESAESVCPGDDLDANDVLDLLSHLVDKSLVNARPVAHGDVRYSLLETMRQYGREKLAPEEATQLRFRHLDYFTGMAERAEVHLLTSAQEWLDAIDQEHDNIREALEFGKEFPEATPRLLRLVGSVWMFWMVRCFLNEGREWTRAAVERSEGAGAAVRAKVLTAAARLAWTQGDHHSCVALSERCLELQSHVDTAWPPVIALQLLGNCCQYYLSDLPRALEYHQRGLDLAERAGHRWLLALSLVNLGEAVQASGQSARASRLFEDGFSMASEVGDRWVAGLALGNLASGALLAGDLERAATYYGKSVLLRKQLQDRRGLAGCLEGIAILAQLEGQHERAARLFGSAESQRELIGASLTFVLTRVDSNDSLGALRAALSAARFATLWTEGREMTLDQAIEYAVEPLGGLSQDVRT